MQIKNIIFDLGGVLMDWNPHYLYDRFFDGNAEKAEWFVKNVCTMDWNVAQDAGRSFAEGIALKTAEFPDYKEAIEAYFYRWEEMCNGCIDSNLTILEKLYKSKAYELFALTNFSAETWEKALKIYPFLNMFKGIIVSGKVKMRKPFPPIYKHLLTEFDLAANASVFIDDSLPNVATAQALGMHGIHYTPNTDLATALKKLHINI